MNFENAVPNIIPPPLSQNLEITYNFREIQAGTDEIIQVRYWGRDTQTVYVNGTANTSKLEVEIVPFMFPAVGGSENTVHIKTRRANLWIMPFGGTSKVSVEAWTDNVTPVKYDLPIIIPSRMGWLISLIVLLACLFTTFVVIRQRVISTILTPTGTVNVAVDSTKTPQPIAASPSISNTPLPQPTATDTNTPTIAPTNTLVPISTLTLLPTDTPTLVPTATPCQEDKPMKCICHAVGATYFEARPGDKLGYLYVTVQNESETKANMERTIQFEQNHIPPNHFIYAYHEYCLFGLSENQIPPPISDSAGANSGQTGSLNLRLDGIAFENDMAPICNQQFHVEINVHNKGNSDSKPAYIVLKDSPGYQSDRQKLPIIPPGGDYVVHFYGIIRESYNASHSMQVSINNGAIISPARQYMLAQGSCG